MKALLLKTFCMVALAFSMASCSSDEAAETVSGDTSLVQEYSYNETELELAREINDYRISIGLDPLQTINHISFKSGEHNQYMIANQVVNHDYFEERSNNIMHVLGAVTVNENVAYNYTTPAGVLHAWLNSPGHRANIEGYFTHFGISVSEDPKTGKKYYTNIFIRK
ncbi:MAG TPA: CAP domain-containing protein [Flavobacterium sp.]|jgi:uncharacterized protein YkwD